MVASMAEKRVTNVLKYLPRGLRDEILALSSRRREGLLCIREIRVRRDGRSSLRFGNESVPLYTPCCEEDMSDILEALCGGSPYAFRSTINEGYIAAPGGVRVGLCGSVRYGSEGAMGVSGISTFVFRIPGHRCVFASELESVYRSGVGYGMLIYSPPGVGKTTALRSLAASSEPIAPKPHRAEMTIREAVLSPCEIIAVERSEGRICASPTVSCPPAVPIVISGERITVEDVRLFIHYGIKTVSVVK